MNIRAFVSVDIPGNIKKEIKKSQEKLPEFRGKLTETENLHLTLKFLGWIDEAKIGAIKERLEKIKQKGFVAEIDSIGVFDESQLRIIWLHIKGPEALQKTVDNALSDLFVAEKRFMSHLTIARVKSVENKKRFIDKLKKIKFEKIRFVVNEFRLKKSILTRSGPKYQDLEVYGLE